jgi:hypothetical protein
MKKRNLKKYQGFTRKTVARECIIRGLTLWFLKIQSKNFLVQKLSVV